MLSFTIVDENILINFCKNRVLISCFYKYFSINLAIYLQYFYMIAGVFKRRQLEQSTLYKIVLNYHETYEDIYEERYESEYGYLEPK